MTDADSRGGAVSTEARSTQKTLHPVWREKKDIEANLENRESF